MQGDNVDNSNDSNDTNSRNDRHVVLIGNEQKTRAIKPSVFLAGGWEEHFTFQDFLGFKNWDEPVLKKKRRGFVISKYHSTCLTKIDEEKLFIGNYSDLMRGLIYTGLFSIAKCNNLNDKKVENLLQEMRSTINNTNEYMEELLSKTNRKEGEVKSLFRKYGNHYICKRYYEEKFKEKLVLELENKNKLNKNIQKLCYEITENKPGISSFRLNESKESKSVSLWIHREMLKVAEKIQSSVFNYEFVISEILRGSLMQGLHMVTRWIINNEISNDEQNVMKIIVALEDIAIGK